VESRDVACGVRRSVAEKFYNGSLTPSMISCRSAVMSGAVPRLTSRHQVMAVERAHFVVRQRAAMSPDSFDDGRFGEDAVAVLSNVHDLARS
jgi:hypothetical protein